MTSNEHLRTQLEARNQRGLYDVLAAAEGQVLAGRYRVVQPFAAGGQALLFEAQDADSGRVVLIKQASFDYRRPIQYSRADAASRREPLRVEHDVLRACSTGHLPSPLAFLRAPSLVPAARGSNVLGEETFLVMERIRGAPLDQIALSVWPRLPSAIREQSAKTIASEYLRFWEALRASGHFYGDTNARNILLEEGTARLRVVDAACVLPAAARVTLREAAPAFLTPRLLASALEGRPLPGNAATMLPALGKVLHFLLTRLQPLNGQLPPADPPELREYTQACREALQAMTAMDGDEASLDRTMAALRSWFTTPTLPG